ncbi:hypothetical protein F2Q65_16360 [Thiohalocapsa marina]|uniref:Uncharacterized protein n=1 Tax=Thiohalocapsa marina TaxID=424902 RepID=A0A5M8FJ14_9GAMM|nr:glycoside hydrolase family 9 protein [Thiohalocapsa marina]KAA6183161.1 hypothetical protein F2Q65_16360 [Thiohalocapsa marina]
MQISLRRAHPSSAQEHPRSTVGAATAIALATLFLVFSMQPLGAIADDLLLYDEDAATQLSQLERITETAEAAHDSAVGLRVTPTYWHTPFFRLAAGRTDFRPYTSLEFSVRSTAGTLDPTILAIDYAQSRELPISDYAEGGLVDETWRRVRIPVADLVSDAFGLESVYLIGFGPMANPQPFDIDNFVLRDERRPAVLGWEALSDRTLAVIMEQLDPYSLNGTGGDVGACDGNDAQADTFTVSSRTDSGYREARTPVAVGSSRSAVEVAETGLGVRSESRLYLLLPEALRPGHDYHITLGPVRSASGLPMENPSLELTYVEPAISSSIKVNQVGYAPYATKIAFVGNWLGNLGPMPVDGRDFYVVDADKGKHAYCGQLQLRAAHDPNSGEAVYTADFSALSTPGRYRVVVPGLGGSYPFEIRDDIYTDVYTATMRVFYHKRNTTLTYPFADTGFERDGILPALNALYHPVLADYPLSRGEIPFDFKPITGGWFDAGDYGQYIHNAAPIWGLIGLALDLAAPGQFGDGELGIPESGNGIPDVIDELGWGMEWALSMQDTDGGVYWRVTPAEWDWLMPGDVLEPRYLYEKTTRATAQFAAMGAIYSRLIRPYDPVQADAVLQAALRAWSFVDTHPVWPPEGTLYENPDELPGGGTYPASSAKPDLLWAAAELYRTTAQPAYQDAVHRLLGEVNIDITAAPYSTLPFWALVNANHGSRDPLLLQRAQQGLAAAADVMVERAAASAYRSPKHPFIPYTGWHNFAGSPIQSLALLQGHHLTGQPVYLDLAWQVVDILLGANPLSQTWLTGFGGKPVKDPLDRVSLSDDQDAPLRGLPVPGPIWHLPGFREPYIAFNKAFYPPEQPPTAEDWHSAYPVFRRYLDSHHLIPMNESTIREMAAIAMAFGLLRDAGIALPIREPEFEWTPSDAGDLNTGGGDTASSCQGGVYKPPVKGGPKAS